MNLLTFLGHINHKGGIRITVTEKLNNYHTKSQDYHGSGEAVSVEVITQFICPDSEVQFPTGVSCRFWKSSLLKNESFLIEGKALKEERKENPYWDGLDQAVTYSRKFGSGLKLETADKDSVTYWFDLLLLYEDKYLTCLSPDLENIMKSKSTYETDYTIAEESYNIPKLRKFYTINCPYKSKKLSNLKEISKKMEWDQQKTYEHHNQTLIPRRRSTYISALSL